MRTLLSFRFDPMLGLILRTHSIDPDGLISDLPLDEKEIYYDTWSLGRPCHVSGNYFLTITEDEFANINLHTWEVSPLGIINDVPISNLFLPDVTPLPFRTYRVQPNIFLFAVLASDLSRKFYTVRIDSEGVISPSLISSATLPAAYGGLWAFELLSPNRAFITFPVSDWDIGFNVLSISDDGILSMDPDPLYKSKYWERQPITFFPVSPSVIGMRVTQKSGIKGWNDIDLIPQPEVPPQKRVLIRRTLGGLYYSLMDLATSLTITYPQSPYPRAVQIATFSDTEIYGGEQYVTEYGEYYDTDADLWLPDGEVRYKTKLKTKSFPFDPVQIDEFSYSAVNENEAIFRKVRGQIVGCFYVSDDVAKTYFSTRAISASGAIGPEISNFLVYNDPVPTLDFFRARGDIYMFSHNHPVSGLPTFFTLRIYPDGQVPGPILDSLTLAVDDPTTYFSLMHPGRARADHLPFMGIGR